MNNGREEEGRGDRETRKNGRGDKETRRHGDKTSGLRVSVSLGRPSDRTTRGSVPTSPALRNAAAAARKKAGSASKSPPKSPRKNGHGDTGTRRRGDKTSGLRISSSVARKKAGSDSKSPLKSPRLPVPPSPRRSFPLITLLTDFGLADYFVAAMKGVILSANPKARLVDITHEIPPHDMEAGAFALLGAYAAFPSQTIHLAVVDPGVGSSRRPILVVTRNQMFVGPDNGIFSYIIDREREAHVFHITNEEYFRQPVSATFHGRDVFAPVAAALSLGVRPEEFGAEIKDQVRLKPLRPDILKKGSITARIIHIDHFGNCITSLTQRELTPEMIKDGARLTIKRKTIKIFRRFFAAESDHKEKLFAVWGSAGFLEIAAQNRSAAKLLNVERGEPVLVLTQE